MHRGRPAWVRVIQRTVSPFPVLDSIAGGVFGMGLVALAVYGLISVFHWPQASLPIALFACLLLFISAVRLQRELDESRVSHLAFEAEVAKRTVPTFGSFRPVLSGGRLGAEEQRVGEVEVFLVSVKNTSPINHPDADITDAIATLAFYPGGSVVPELECPARWTGADAPTLGKSIDSIHRRRLPATGERHEIDVFLRHPGELEIYAATNELMMSNFRNDKYHLRDDDYRINVTVMGHGLAEPVSAWFRATKEPDGIRFSAGESHPPSAESKL